MNKLKQQREEVENKLEDQEFMLTYIMKVNRTKEQNNVINYN